MKLVVKNNNGEKFTLQIRPEETFLDLKERVVLESGISLDLRDITNSKRSINENQKVIDYFLNEQNRPQPAPVQDVVCAVPTCRNRKSVATDKTYFDFPSEEIRCHQWVLYCRRIASRLSAEAIKVNPAMNAGAPGTAICSDHFKPEQFVKNTTTILKRTAVPSINPELPVAGVAAPAPSQWPKSSISQDGCQMGSHNNSRFSEVLPAAQPSNEIVDPGKNSRARHGVANPRTCRLCGRLSQHTVFIYSEEGKNLSLPEKIAATLPIRIKMTDNLPKQVCLNCIDRLEAAFHFVEIITAADDRMHKSTEKTQGEPKCWMMGDQCPCCRNIRLQIVQDVEPDNHCEKEINLFPAQLDDEQNEEVDNDSEEHSPRDEMGSELGDQNLSLADMMDLEISLTGDEVYCEKCGTHFPSFLSIPDHKCNMIKPPLGRRCKVCFRTFGSNHRYQFHLKYHTGVLRGYCTVCGKFCQSEWRHYVHVVEKHWNAIGIEEFADGATQCEDCGKVVPSMNAFKYHVRSHSKTDAGAAKPFACDNCGKLFARKSMLRNHITSAHRTAQELSCFTCKVCHEAFPSTSHAVAHMDAAHSDEIVNEISYSFEMMTVVRLFQCEYCEKLFARSLILIEHRRRHHPSSSQEEQQFYSCKICGETFISYIYLQEHKSKHSPAAVPVEYQGDLGIPVCFSCEFCERSFVSHTKYTEHLTIHFGSEPYVCRSCGLKFAELESATEHRQLHGDTDQLTEPVEPGRPYQCHYCDKNFGIEDALTKHIRMHTGEKPFMCDVCGKGFSQSSGLNTHKKVHSDYRPFACTLCPRSFKIKGDRDVHIRKHSGQRPFTCEFCLKSFMTQHVYSQHRKIHTGERPYRCDVCELTFRRSHVLTVHKRIHTGEKPNVCDVCGKRYRQKGDMLKHKRSQHGLVRHVVNSIESIAVENMGSVECEVEGSANHFLAIKTDSMDSLQLC
ncbi:Zinc finger, C2H2 type [Nesidiocoris tenuis]|uniref:Zinc finger, C2H2 type n=1 Tax=Nesidiocoris tenuis TaxID=355587 RepID=A0ABN7BHT9_9HEMI|nr:Zinc finger, C2H2 type [Nesidiocoris tenuis]